MKKRLIPLMLVLLLLTGCEKKEPEPETPVETEDVAKEQDGVINYGGCTYNNEETTVEHLSPSMMACTDSEGREYTVALVQSYETYYKRAIAKKYGTWKNAGDGWRVIDHKKQHIAMHTHPDNLDVLVVYASDSIKAKELVAKSTL